MELVVEPSGLSGEPAASVLLVVAVALFDWPTAIQFCIEPRHVVALATQNRQS